MCLSVAVHIHYERFKGGIGRQRSYTTLGPILHADILSSAPPVVLTRFDCVLNAPKGRSPVLISVAPQSPPLSSGPWGVARPGAQLLAR